jgi:hypothetical protein
MVVAREIETVFCWGIHGPRMQTPEVEENFTHSPHRFGPIYVGKSISDTWITGTLYITRYGYTVSPLRGSIDMYLVISYDVFHNHSNYYLVI